MEPQLYDGSPSMPPQPLVDNPAPASVAVRPIVLLRRSLKLRCPACGQGRLFRTRFSMFDSCTACGYSFQREPGFYLGSIYVNYGLTAVMVTGSYIYMLANSIGEDWQRMVVLVPFSLVFPIWFFPYARAVWLGFDYRWDPPQPDLPGGKDYRAGPGLAAHSIELARSEEPVHEESSPHSSSG